MTNQPENKPTPPQDSSVRPAAYVICFSPMVIGAVSAYFNLASQISDPTSHLVAAVGAGVGTGLGGYAGFLAGCKFIKSASEKHKDDHKAMASAGLAFVAALGVGLYAGYEITTTLALHNLGSDPVGASQASPDTSRISDPRKDGLRFVGRDGQGYVLSVA